MGVISIILLLERSPPLYHAYTAMTVFLWTQIFSEYRFIKALWKQLHGRRVYYIAKILATCAVSVFISEFLVLKSNIQQINLLYVEIKCCCQYKFLNRMILQLFQVNSFTERKLYTWYFLVVGVVGSVYQFKSIPWRSGIPVFVCVVCWLLSIFTLMPAEIPDNTYLV